MSEFEYETRPADREGLKEFLAGLREADPEVVSDMAVIACQVIANHNRMKDLSYWLLNNGGLFGYDTSASGEDRRARNEEELRKLAGSLEIHGDPVQVDAVVRRYEDMTPAGRNRRV